MSLETDSISTAYIQSLQEQIHLLRRIVKVAGSILSQDDSFEQIRKWYDEDGGLRDQYIQARADYFKFTGRSV